MLAAGIATDTRSLDALKGAAARDPKAALREAARQFEALFMQELMKSMRATTLPSGLADNEGSRLGHELLDAQLATQLGGLPGGLADAIARQLEGRIAGGAKANGAGAAAASGVPTTNRASGAPAPATSASGARPNDASGAHANGASGAATTSASGTPATHRASSASTTGAPAQSLPQGAADFVARHAAAAHAAERASGIPAHFMLGQAGHESGWGRHEIRSADGTPSHNLFGIKAGAGWKGAVAETTTTEYIDGRPHKQVAKFRAYASYDEAFRDYARLVAGSARYERALASPDGASFAGALQRAGYATDPAYASKLTRAINTSLRLARATG